MRKKIILISFTLSFLSIFLYKNLFEIKKSISYPSLFEKDKIQKEAMLNFHKDTRVFLDKKKEEEDNSFKIDKTKLVLTKVSEDGTTQYDYNNGEMIVTILPDGRTFYLPAKF